MLKGNVFIYLPKRELGNVDAKQIAVKIWDDYILQVGVS